MKKFLKLTLFSLVVASLVLVLTSPTETIAATKSKDSMVKLVDVLISVGVISFDDIVRAKVWAEEMDKQAEIEVASSTAYIQVLEPKKGAAWDIDNEDPYDIVWGSQGVEKVDISLIGGKSGNCLLSEKPVLSNKKENTFEVFLEEARCLNLKTGTSTPVLDGSYKIRIYGQDVNGIMVENDKDYNVKINPILIPSVKVTYPNGKEVLSRQDTHKVKYSISNFTEASDGQVHLKLIDSEGNTAYTTKQTMKDSSISLKLPRSIPAGAYRVELSITTKDDSVTVTDASDNLFWISAKY